MSASAFPEKPEKRADEKAAFVFVCLLSFLPVLAVFAPRFLAYGPSLIGLAIYIYYGIKYGAWKPQNRALLLAVLIIPALAGLSSLWSVDRLETLERTAKMMLVLIPAALGISSLRYTPRSVVKKWLWLTPLSVGLCLGLVYFQLLFDMPLYKLLNGLSQKEFANPSELNRPTVTGILSLFISLAILRTYQMKKAMFILLLLTLAVLSATQSQSAILAVLAGAVLFAGMPARRPWVWSFLFLVTAALILWAPFLGLQLFGYVADLDGSALRNFFANSYAAERLEIWHFVSKHILYQPWLGYGIEATRSITFETHQIYYEAASVLHPHNFALQIWIEFGALGALVSCGMLYYLLQKIRAHGDREVIRMEMATLYATMAVAAVGYGLWQGWWLGLLTLLCFYTTLFRLSVDQIPPDAA